MKKEQNPSLLTENQPKKQRKKRKNQIINIVIFSAIFLFILFLLRNHIGQSIVRLLHKNPFEITLVDEDCWAEAKFLFSGHFNGDDYEDVLVIAEPKNYPDKINLNHFYLLPGGPKMSQAVVPVSLIMPDDHYFENSVWINDADVGDFNHDGVLDIAYTTRNGIYLWEGQKDSLAFKLQHVLESRYTRSDNIEIADFDNDGKNEIVALTIYHELLVTKLFEDTVIQTVEMFFKKGSYSVSRFAEKTEQKDSVPTIELEVHNYFDMQFDDIDGDLDKDMVLMVDKIRSVDFYIFENTQDAFILRDQESSAGKFPNNAIIRQKKFTLCNFRDSTRDIASITYLYGNYESVSFLNMHYNITDTGEEMHYSYSDVLINKETVGLDYGITKGRFKSDREYVICYGDNDFTIFHHEIPIHRYFNKKDRDFNASIRCATSCDLNNDGVDEPVFLMIGRLAHKDDLGAYLFIYKEDIFPETE